MIHIFIVNKKVGVIKRKGDKLNKVGGLPLQTESHALYCTRKVSLDLRVWMGPTGGKACLEGFF